MEIIDVTNGVRFKDDFDDSKPRVKRSAKGIWVDTAQELL